MPAPSPFRAALGETGSIARLAAPLSSGLIVSTSTTLVDTAMLGHLGAVPLAAVSLASSVVIMFYAALYGAAGPASLFAGRAQGAGDTAGIGDVGRHGAVLGLGAGLAGALGFAALLPVLGLTGQPADVMAVITPYWLCLAGMLVPFTLLLVAKGLLDAADRPWTGVGLSLVVLGVHVLANWVLIDGRFGFPALGLVGAGIASLLSQTFGAALFWGFVRFAPWTRAWWGERRFTREGFAKQWREALPMTTQYFLEGGAVGVAGVLIGWFGAVALAGNQVALSVGVVAYMLPLGIAGAVTIRVAQAIGGGDAGRVRAIGGAGLAIVTLWMGLIALVFLLAADALARAFVTDEAIVAAAVGIFVVYGLTQLFDGVQSVSLGALRGMLDNVWPMKVSIVAYWLISLPASVVIAFPLGLGAPGVWLGFGIGLAIAATALLWRFVSRTRPLSESA